MPVIIPEISIIVPVYNAEKWLPYCVDSILAQKYTPFELILIDDGSLDGSGAICDEYATRDSRVRVFHKENGGVSSARNLGLDHAYGEWILFVDADDSIYPEMLDTLYKASGINDIIFFSVSELLEDGTQIDYLAKEVQSDNSETTQQSILYLKNNKANYPFFGYTWSKLFRRNIIEEFHIRFVNGFAFFEDELFTDDYCKNITRLKTLSSPLYYYRRTSSGLTGEKRKTKDLIFLSQKLLEISDYYSHIPLKIYELERSLSFLKEAIDTDKNLEFYIEEKRLLKRIDKKFTHKCKGKQLKIIRSFSPFVGMPLLKSFRFIKNRRRSQKL